MRVLGGQYVEQSSTDGRVQGEPLAKNLQAGLIHLLLPNLAAQPELSAGN